MTRLAVVDATEPPSDYAIEALYRGERDALGRVLILTAVRSVPIAAGLYVAGVRRNTFKTALTTSAVLTAFMFGYVAARDRGLVG